MNLMFDCPLIDGLDYCETIIGEAEEADLVQRLNSLEPARERAATFARLDPADFVHVLVARYDPGAGIGWHRDRDVFEKVVGISLGTPATLRFRQRTQSGFDRANLELEPRSAYLLSGKARWSWEHSIIGGKSLRFSITFRTLSDKGRRIATDHHRAGTVQAGNG